MLAPPMAAKCGHPGRQYGVALVDWRQRSLKTLETRLDWLSGYLNPAGVLVVWVDPQKPAANQALREMLERHGFHVEAGTAGIASIKPIARCTSPALTENRRSPRERAGSI